MPVPLEPLPTPWKVLVADSQLMFAEALARALAGRLDVEMCEPHPHTGTGAAQAAIILQAEVVVLDLWLHGVTAVAATDSILAQMPDCRIVVLGWLHSAADLHHALEAGASAFVCKQLGVDKVADAVAYAAHGRRVVMDPHYRVATKPTERQEPGHSGRPTVGDRLTVRELEVLRLLGAGLPVEDIAARLDIAPKTAQTHITHVLEKTDAHSQLQAIAAARHRRYLI